jgi:biotin-dependent carboxylase-like uncharacterized protein
MSGRLSVLSVGPLATVQDAGRAGYQRFGLSPCGALDPDSLAIANLLLGQAEAAAAIELTLLGGRFRAEAVPLTLAFAGDFPLDIDGRAVPAWTSFHLEPGQVLRIGAVQTGCRGYLACRGGFAAEHWLGSASTDLKAGRGGHQGRCLQPGDQVAASDPPLQTGQLVSFPGGDRPAWRKQIRIIPGPQDDYFTEDVRARLLDGPYRVSEKLDRMGIRLNGAALPADKGHNIISDAVAPGSVQVPPQGEPIILLADRQTTGGYPKIATVISTDMPCLAQLRPGDAIAFQQVTVEQARAAAAEHRHKRSLWRSHMVPVAMAGPLDVARLLGSNLISGVVSGRET